MREGELGRCRSNSNFDWSVRLVWFPQSVNLERCGGTVQGFVS